MSTPKPRIRPKAAPHRQRSQAPTHDPPSYPDLDPPILTERDPGMERGAADRIIFQEEDCLR